MLPFELTKDTPYLALSGELWSVFYEYFNRNWSCYKGFLLYFTSEFFKVTWPIVILTTSYVICLKWVPQNHMDKTTLVQVMSW